VAALIEPRAELPVTLRLPSPGRLALVIQPPSVVTGMMIPIVSLRPRDYPHFCGPARSAGAAMRSVPAPARRHSMRLVTPLRVVGSTILLLAVLVTATTAASDGYGISWGSTCWGETGSTSYLTWACNSNTNANIRMTCSFKLEQPVSDFQGLALYLDGYSTTSAVPDWWKLGRVETGDCRAGALSVSVDGSVLANAGQAVCLDPWNGAGLGGLGLYSWDTNRMHISAMWALPNPVALEANTEYFALQVRINANKTVGDCAGCDAPVLWAIHHIEYGSTTANHYIVEPYDGAPEYLSWQGATKVPTLNTTWGQIKSLYR
jgi:hypothetical protein